MGPTGFKGSTGLKGNKGNRGSTGIQGPKGECVVPPKILVFSGISVCVCEQVCHILLLGARTRV